MKLESLMTSVWPVFDQFLTSFVQEFKKFNLFVSKNGKVKTEKVKGEVKFKTAKPQK